MKKQILILFISLLIAPIIVYSQNDVFPDFTLERSKIDTSWVEQPSAELKRINDSIVKKQIEYVKELPKFNFKDTSFSTFLNNDFSFKADSFFEFSMNHQIDNKDSMWLSVSFKNTSSNGMYVGLPWYMDSLGGKIANFSTVSIDFGLDCFSFFRMKKVNSQEVLNDTSYINHLNFESVVYEFYIVNDMNKLINSSRYPDSFTQRIREDELAIDGILDTKILDYQGLSSIHIFNYPINDKIRKVSFSMKNK